MIERAVGFDQTNGCNAFDINRVALMLFFALVDALVPET